LIQFNFVWVYKSSNWISTIQYNSNFQPSTVAFVFLWDGQGKYDDPKGRKNYTPIRSLVLTSVTRRAAGAWLDAFAERLGFFLLVKNR
jgi:hypothetical protein